MASMRQTSHRVGPARRRALAAVAFAFAFAAVAPGAFAGDGTHAFKPVDEYGRSVVFKPQRIDGARVLRASVTYRVARAHLKKAVKRERRVPVRRVQRALEHGKRLKVKKPRRARGAKLVVRSAKGTRGPASGACAFGTFSSQNLPGACWRPYADTSPFNRGVGSAPRLVANSSAIVNRVNGFGPPDNLSAGNSSDWGHPTYYSRPGDPLYTVHCTESWGTCELEGAQIRIPAASRPATAADAHMTVVDQATGWEYDFWQVRSKPSGGGTLSVSWGGKTRIGTPDADGLASNATAAHFGLLAGVIRPPELAAGQIDHALTMSVSCTNGTYVWPAEGPGAGTVCADRANAPAMGQHFVLNMSDGEISSLNVPGWKKTILTAMAHYGLFVGDTGGAAWGIQLESSATYTSFGYVDPWAQLGAAWGVPKWGGDYVFSLRDGVDWGRLAVVDPCVSRGAC
jgi:hypothetical protein